MLNIWFDSIAIAGGYASTDDWRIREAMHKAHRTDAVASPPSDPVRLEKVAAENAAGSIQQPQFFDSTSNRVMI